jgi:ABC-2 type transport system permease protein
VSADASGPSGEARSADRTERRSPLDRTWLATRIELVQVRRDPLLLALLVGLPAYFVGAWGVIVPDATMTTSVPAADGATTIEASMPELVVAIIAPVASALVVGITALFVVQRSHDVDRRLGIAGYRPVELLGARLATLGGMALLVTGVTVAVSWLHLVPEHPLWLAVAVALAGGIYGSIGALLGQILDRMAGVYCLLFAPLIDVMILQSPLAEQPWWTAWLPGHHPSQLAASAAFADAVAVEHALGSVAVLVVLVGAVGVATTIRMR